VSILARDRACCSTPSHAKRTFPNMRSNFVSLHPYFKVHPGKLEAVKSVFRRFVEKTASETENLFYGFSINGDEVCFPSCYGQIFARYGTPGDIGRTGASPAIYAMTIAEGKGWTIQHVSCPAANASTRELHVFLNETKFSRGSGRRKCSRLNPSGDQRLDSNREKSGHL
jgi:hypothetical protein